MMVIVSFSVGFLIAGGEDNDMTEVVQFNTNDKTPSFGQLPTPRCGSIGAMLGSVPILCGTRPEDFDGDTCLSFKFNEWQQSHHMTEKRWLLAGVQLNYTTLWVLGGYAV